MPFLMSLVTAAVFAFYHFNSILKSNINYSLRNYGCWSSTRKTSLSVIVLQSHDGLQLEARNIS